MRGGDHVRGIVAGGSDQIAGSTTVEGDVMTAESTGVEGAGVYRGEGHLHLVASQRPQSCSRESRKDRHLDGITMDQVVEPVGARNSRLGMSVDMCVFIGAPRSIAFSEGHGRMAIASRIPYSGRRWTVESSSEPRTHAA